MLAKSLTSRESNRNLCSSRCQKVINLLVDVDGACEILDTADLGLNQVVAVDGGGYGGRRHPCGHELKNSNRVVKQLVLRS